MSAVRPLTVSDVPDAVAVPSAAPDPVYRYVTVYESTLGPDAGADHDRTPDRVLDHEMDGDVGGEGRDGLVDVTVAADRLSP